MRWPTFSLPHRASKPPSGLKPSRPEDQTIQSNLTTFERALYILPQCATPCQIPWWGLVSMSWHHYSSSPQNSRPSPRSLPPPAPPPDWPCRLETQGAAEHCCSKDDLMPRTPQPETPLCSLLSVNNVTMTSTKQLWSEETLFIRMNQTQKKGWSHALDTFDPSNLLFKSSLI